MIGDVNINVIGTNMLDRDLLENAISRAGGATKLARALGVRQNTVSMWRARGRLPRGWAMYLREMLANPAWPQPPRGRRARRTRAAQG